MIKKRKQTKPTTKEVNKIDQKDLNHHGAYIRGWKTDSKQVSKIWLDMRNAKQEKRKWGCEFLIEWPVKAFLRK